MRLRNCPRAEKDQERSHNVFYDLPSEVNSITPATFHTWEKWVTKHSLYSRGGELSTTSSREEYQITVSSFTQQLDFFNQDNRIFKISCLLLVILSLTYLLLGGGGNHWNAIQQSCFWILENGLCLKYFNDLISKNPVKHNHRQFDTEKS